MTQTPASRAPRPRAHRSADGALRSRPLGLLSAAQERDLASRVARGDAEARDMLVRSNLGLVFTIARDYLGRGLEMDDLAAEGDLGLIRAAQDFRAGFGTRFSTYAAYWIKESIRRALTSTTATIRLPSHMVTLLSKWRQAERSLARELGRAPTPAQVAITLGLSEAQRGLIGHALRTRHLGGEDSMDERGGDGPPEPGAGIERAEAAADLRRRMVARLDVREREIIALRFGLEGGDPLTLKEVGRRLGVTREWARKIEWRAIAKLRADEHAGA